MNIFIISDDPALGEKVRLLIANEGFDCPSSNILPITKAVAILNKETPDLVAVVLEPNIERAQAVLMTAKGQRSHYVLAIGPTVDTRLVLRVLRAGADDYVDSSSLATELKEAVRRWRGKLQNTLATGKIISLIASNGGCGASTLAANLSVSLAQRNERVLLLDLHLRTDDLASLLDLKPTYSIANLCASLAGMDRALFDKALTPHESGVQLLAPPRRTDDIPSVTPPGVCQIMALSRSTFPFVIVDVEVDADETMKEVLIQSDLILLVIKPDVSSLRNAKRLLDRLEWLGISPLSVRSILSRVGQPAEVSTSKVEAALRSKAFHIIPEDLKVVNSCNNLGVPVVKEAPRSRYAYAVTALVSEIHKVLLTTPSSIKVKRAAQTEADTTATMIETLQTTPDRPAGLELVMN